MTKKDHESKEPEKFLGPGAAGDVNNPSGGSDAFGVLVQEPDLSKEKDVKEADKK